ncbi:MAG: DUF2116 family Zn-ribbon domain-containing protein [Candidatus Helarchaeota archaeon]
MDYESGWGDDIISPPLFNNSFRIINIFKYSFHLLSAIDFRIFGRDFISTTTETSQKKQKWIKKWEPHAHCQVCGIAIPINRQYCSNKCSGEYYKWKKKKEKKSKYTTFAMFGMIIVMVIFMIIFSFSGLF